MRFPWSRRADQAREERVNTESRLQRIRAEWPNITAQAAVTRRERELNGWTATVETLFSGRRR